MQDPADPALAVVRRLQAQFPGRDIALVVDPTPHGANRKVGNLINMLPAARHDVLVIADSDVHVAPDYLRPPGRGAGAAGDRAGHHALCRAARRVAWRCAVQRLGADADHPCFLPGALLARALGRQDCLGATMVLRRQTLERIGGLAALVDHLADDNVLGRLVRRARAARWRWPTPCRDHRAGSARSPRCGGTSCAGRAPSGRWCPVPFAASVLQYPLFAWALLALACAGARLVGWGLFAARLG